MTTVDDILAHISEKPWSDYTEADYSIEQWHAACLIHQHQGPPSSKAQCKLPVKTPNGAVNRNGVHAAAAALAGARAELKASDDEKASARKALIRLYGQLGEDPPDSLKHTPLRVFEAILEHAGFIIELVEDEDAEQAGVKGMKWGVRRAVDPSTGLVKRTSSEDQIHIDRIVKKINSHGTSSLSNRDLQDFSRRLQLEGEFNRALALHTAKTDGFIKNFLKKQGSRQFNRVADKAVDLAVEKALESAGVKVTKKNKGLGEGLTEISDRLKPKQKKKGGGGGN